MPHERTGDERAQQLIPRRIAFAVTLGALALAAAHVAWPHLEIDSVTLVLIGIALAPWIAPLLKSFELGGAKFEFRELRQQVETLATTVEEVKALVITGATPGQTQRLTAAVDDFQRYLRDIGVGQLPQVAVRIEAGIRNAYYDGSAQQIVLDPQLSSDPYPVLRQYAHHVLFTALPKGWAELGAAGAAIESGLADYLVASHTGSAALGAQAATALGGDGPIRNLDNKLSFEGLDASASSQQGGEIWGAIFWELRQAIGPTIADPLLVRVWSAAPKFGPQTTWKPFVAALTAEIENAVGASTATELRANLARRGVPVP